MAAFNIDQNQLQACGLTLTNAQELLEQFHLICHRYVTPENIWQAMSHHLSQHSYSFAVHLCFFTTIYPQWREYPDTAPAWLPEGNESKQTNLTRCMNELNFSTVQSFHQWTTKSYPLFWEMIIDKLGILFKQPPEKIIDLKAGLESPHWLPGAQMNIVDTCFASSSKQVALIYPDHAGNMQQITFGELLSLTNRIANSLQHLGFQQKDVIGIIMPMNIYAVAIYLAIIKIGAIVVSIADSFSSQEIATRLKIAGTKAVFTQDFVLWSGKELALFEKVKLAFLHTIIVIPQSQNLKIKIDAHHLAWVDFLIENNEFKTVFCDPMANCHILFSSGTTAEPKAIPWNHTTAIKVASDAYFHQNIQIGDILCWPTNLGWMMGPWLIFAAFINHAAIALYPDAPKDRAFGKFVEQAKVTMLGVVPTLVATWRQTTCMENLNWHAIKVFSSTGECSNAEDMLYLMFLAAYKPIIEYCGGTEIGGSYITSTVIEKNYPSLFSTPAMGLNFIIINDKGEPAESGEVAIIPPSIGLSTQLLNADHHTIYYSWSYPFTQLLRKHGDQIKRLPSSYYALLGRRDDAMNLGGIKVSAAEIERTLTGIEGIGEVAAIALTAAQGPSQLVIYATTKIKLDKKQIMKEMQQRINTQLNPLFKIHDVIFIEELPKTASNKIMRRVLRNDYYKCD